MSSIKQEYLTVVREILKNLERDSFYDLIEAEMNNTEPEEKDLKIMKKLLKELLTLSNNK